MTFSLTPSKINTYRLCPFKYKCEFDPRIREAYRRESPDLVLGNLIHACLNDLYKRTKKADRSLETLRKLFEVKFKAHLPKHLMIFGNQDKVISSVEDAKQQFANFVKSDLFAIEPMITEEFPKYRLTKDLEIGGKFDRVDFVDNGLILIDYKTGKYREEENNTFQLNFYELLLAKLYPHYNVKQKILFFLRENKIVVYDSQSERLLQVQNDVISLADTIKNDRELKPTRNSMCRFCDYRPICPLMK